MRTGGLNKIFDLAKEDSKIIFIGSDLGAGVLSEFKKEIPEQFFMEGISEANIIGMASGMAMMGYIVYINTIATFLTRRCYEQICIDLCLEKQKVRLFANGGGLIYGPMGPTHTTLEDVAIMSALPNMAVVVPADKNQMLELIEQTKNYQGPVYFRVARDNYPDITSKNKSTFGEALLLEEGRDICLISNGFMTQKAVQIRKILAEQGMNVAIIDLHTIKPLNLGSLKNHLISFKYIITMEEGYIHGGIYSIISKIILDYSLDLKLLPIFIENKFFEIYGEQHEILDSIGLSNEEISQKIQTFLRHHEK